MSNVKALETAGEDQQNFLQARICSVHTTDSSNSPGNERKTELPGRISLSAIYDNE